MARIPDEELERLKRGVSLERLVASRGVKLERRGADRVGLCPFHADREPSLVVTPSKNPLALPGRVPHGKCQIEMKIVAVITQVPVILKILNHIISTKFRSAKSARASVFGFRSRSYSVKAAS